MEPLHHTRVGGSSALDRVLAELDTIVVDEFEPGMQLPSEGELALRFGVSRLTIREALKVLAGRDMVELSNGRRAVVLAPTSSTFANHLSVVIRRDPRASLELNEIRQSLEVQAAALAAQRATRASLLAMESALLRMADAAEQYASDGDPDAYQNADLAFHEALALASGNSMLAVVLTSFEDSLRRSFDDSFRGHLKRGKTIGDGLERHRAVFRSVEARDARGASAAMRSCLKESARDIRAAMLSADRKE
jgi:GntR family transcriptional repressor for pyruvate dehydrogenase complex